MQGAPKKFLTWRSEPFSILLSSYDAFVVQVEKPRKLLYGASAVFVYRGTAPRVQMEGG